ncbi:unnamed protein product [Phytophthora lilii]|uniref:Unnamed protein product n=1 Tax=Phytophthora lilii TaxID=2077276 RepID=A0A9W6TEW8_9STRA|nr:unnamed protein product [Phytophthora lilii]
MAAASVRTAAASASRTAAASAAPPDFAPRARRRAASATVTAAASAAPRPSASRQHARADSASATARPDTGRRWLHFDSLRVGILGRAQLFDLDSLSIGLDGLLKCPRPDRAFITRPFWLITASDHHSQSWDAGLHADAAGSRAPAASSRRLGAGKPLPNALLESWKAVDSPLCWDESDGLSLLPESELEVATACRDVCLDKLTRERRKSVVLEGEGEWKEKKEGVEQEDSLNVDELSELFSCVEQEETSGVDFSVFIEDEDAINVEEISQMFSGLEDSKSFSIEEVVSASPVDVVDTKELETNVDVQKSLQHFSDLGAVPASQGQEDADAENVSMLSEIFSATLEDQDATERIAAPTPTYTVAECEDAKNVDLVADLFTSLEADNDARQETVADRSATQDWIDVLEVDNVASLFADLEQAEEMKTKTQTVAPAPVKVDSRIFVPTFSVRIDGSRAGHRPAVGPNSDLLVGPPSVLLAGPPSRQDRVGRWKSKRKTRAFVTKPPDPSISDTRRASAAKRQRVKGRFVSDTHTFVSITALQQ